MRFRIVPIVMAILLLSACDNEDISTTKINTDRYLSAKSTLNTDKTGKVVIILQNYFSLKNAFIYSDEQKIDIAAKSLITACSSLKKQTSNDTSILTINQSIDSIIFYSEQIRSIKDNSVERKRAPLKGVSNTVYMLLKDCQLEGIKIYRQYCPLVFNDNGAYWLSSKKEIQNPYFGKKMLECGEVVDIIE